MSKMHIDESMMSADEKLLPFEREGDVNGIKQMVKIKYPANITMAEEKTSKTSGNLMLKLSMTIKHPDTQEIVPLDDYLSYNKKAFSVPQKNIRHLCEIFKINKNDVDTDLFLDRWVWVTIEHQESKGGNPDPDTDEYPIFKNNKISKYIKELTAKEQKAVLEGQDLPF